MGLSIGNAPPAAPVPWTGADAGLLGASMDPAEAASTVVLTAGTLYLARIAIRSALTISNVLFPVTAAGVGASAGSFAGLYSPAGLLLGQTADIGASLLAAGAPPLSLAAPVPASQYPFVWAALLANLATTQPTIARAGASSASTTMGQAAASFRFAVNGTGLAALPASIVPSANASTPNALLAGVT